MYVGEVGTRLLAIRRTLSMVPSIWAANVRNASDISLSLASTSMLWVNASSLVWASKTGTSDVVLEM